MPQTDTARSKKAYKAKLDKGLVSVRVWVKPHHKADIKAFADKLNEGDK